MSKKIFVGNLPRSAPDYELEDLFSQYGEVTSVRLALDRDTGDSRGFGTVEMADDDAADEAIDALDGYTLGGRTLRVYELRPRDGGRPPRDRR